ncbi:hypothetical protein KEM48_006681 [Puccinia striiformis f. sp. tritici PST-130]|nr:hypothetical protein KEM48_006681 [Puccinia striiformis f. sp. tritici PST-130]
MELTGSTSRTAATVLEPCGARDPVESVRSVLSWFNRPLMEPANDLKTAGRSQHKSPARRPGRAPRASQLPLSREAWRDKDNAGLDREARKQVGRRDLFREMIGPKGGRAFAIEIFCPDRCDSGLSSTKLTPPLYKASVTNYRVQRLCEKIIIN